MSDHHPMSDRAQVLTVVLDGPYRLEDDLQPLISAIKMMKHVIAVAAEVTDHRDYLAIQSVRWRLRDKLLAALDED